MANYKMIGALAVKKGHIERKELKDFTVKHGLVGWAPTQGHIPSGVPYIGPACEDILSGKIKNAMIIGKGSLFLGRMTNLFDGVSFLIHGNTAAETDAEGGVSEEEAPYISAGNDRVFFESPARDREAQAAIRLSKDLRVE
jgi:hypothetical protein